MVKKPLTVSRLRPNQYLVTASNNEKSVTVVVDREDLIELFEAAIYREIPKLDPVVLYIVQNMPNGAKIKRYIRYWFKSRRDLIPMIKVYYEWKGSERFTNLSLPIELMGQDNVEVLVGEA